MRFISADCIYPVSAPPILNGILVLDDSGRVKEVAARNAYPDPEIYSGALVPGFINAHAHLELSHLKGQISEKKGMTGFISEIVAKRIQFNGMQVQAAILAADEEMRQNGIVACGDISNTHDSFDCKRKSRIRYQTFLEVFDLQESETENCLKKALILQKELGDLPSSIVPHAPYTCTSALMKRIGDMKQSLISIHNQETEAENELFEKGTGALADLMQKFGVNIASLQTGTSSLQSFYPILNNGKRIMLVHNTFTRHQDMEWLRSSGAETYFCICPGANLYIEGRLPDIKGLAGSGIPLVIGTDSYASNHKLSVWAGLQVVASHFPEIEFDQLIQWATLNGAKALGMDNEIGSFETGKMPGVNLIEGWKPEGTKWVERARIRPL